MSGSIRPSDMNRTLWSAKYEGCLVYAHRLPSGVVRIELREIEYESSSPVKHASQLGSAVLAYINNDGFADLTLEEWLNKVKPLFLE